MEIKRNTYLQKLINSQNNGLIKIITGIRRCGKSYLLNNIFTDYLINKGVEDSHIIKISLDRFENKKYHNPEILYKYLNSQIKDKKKYYIFLDEVQLVKDFEFLLNSLLHIENVDTYVTGSNSKFLSSDIITEFRGRGDEIKLYPLSFAEFFSTKEEFNDNLFYEYFTYGGLPLVVLQDNIKKKIDYLRYETNNVYLNDVIERNKIQHEEVLSTLVEIISSCIGSLTNSKKLSDTFNTELKIPVTNKTIGTYLEYLEDAFLIQKTKRYDVKGRKYIGTPVKYYFTDMGIRNSLINFRQDEEDHIMENIIYNELKIRGYSVDVGIVEQRFSDNGKNIRKQFEVDFVCNYASQRYYIQSAFGIPNAEKLKQETNSLNRIKDSFKKIIIVKDDINSRHNNDGILIMGLKEFLLNPNSLEL